MTVLTKRDLRKLFQPPSWLIGELIYDLTCLTDRDRVGYLPVNILDRADSLSAKVRALLKEDIVRAAAAAGADLAHSRNLILAFDIVIDRIRKPRERYIGTDIAKAREFLLDLDAQLESAHKALWSTKRGLGLDESLAYELDRAEELEHVDEPPHDKPDLVPNLLQDPPMQRQWPRSDTAQRLASRLLGGAARFLPPDMRADYLREQTANLACSETVAEWFAYLLDQLHSIPHTALVYRGERRRRPTR